MSEYDSFEAAREQAAEMLGFMASDRVKGFEIPNPSLLDDEAQMRLARLELDIETWDRYPKEFSEETKTELMKRLDGASDDAARVQVFEDFAREFPYEVMLTGEMKEPHRKNGELVEPYVIQRAKAIMGDSYEAFRRAGGNASDVSITWWKMNKLLADRRMSDSKSVGRDKGVAPVSEPDSV